MRRDRLQLEMDAGRERERSLGADEQVRQVRVSAVDQGVDVVAADPALQLGKSSIDLAGFPPPQLQHGADQLAVARISPAVAGLSFDRAEPTGHAVGEDGFDRPDIVAHGAVTDRTGAAAVVAGHPADGGAAAGRDVDREHQVVGLEEVVELIEHQARLDAGLAAVRVERENPVEVLADVDDDRLADRLSALRGAAAAGKHRNLLLGGDLDDAGHVLFGPGHDNADRLDLVDRGVGAVTAAAESVEQHLALDLAGQAPGEATVADTGSAGRVRTGCHHWNRRFLGRHTQTLTS